MDVSQIGKRCVAHRSIISEQKEAALGQEFARHVDKSTKLVLDAVVTDYVGRIGSNITRNSDLKAPFTVKVIDSPKISAFSLPGGFLYVTSGLIFFVDDESQLAGAFAHEIAHLAARHWASEMTKAMIARYAWLPPLVIPTSAQPALVCPPTGPSQSFGLDTPLAFVKFCREDEEEADYLALQYLYNVGYDPSSYLTFLGKIGAEESRQTSTVPEIFTGRPTTSDRIRESQKEIKAILQYREQLLVTTSEFDDVRARLSAVVSNLRKRELADQDSSEPPVLRRAPQVSRD